MISCQDFMAEIGNYLEDGVAEEVRRQLEAHLAHCRSCAVICDTAGKTIRVVTDSGSFDIPEGAFKPLADGIMDRIRSSGL